MPERRLIEPVAVRPRQLYPDEIVHNYRVLHGWTQEIAAEHHGISARSWQRYESREYPVPKWLMQEIARYARRVGVAERRYLSS